MEDEAITAVIANSEMEIPDAMLEYQCQNMIDGMAQQLAQQGLSMEQYFQFTGSNMEALMEQAKPEALKRIQTSLVLEAVAETEDFEVTDADVQAEIEKMAKMYNMEAEKLAEYMGESEKESMKKDIAIQKAVDFLVENAEVKEAEKKAKKATAKKETAEKKTTKKTTKKEDDK